MRVLCGVGGELANQVVHRGYSNNWEALFCTDKQSESVTDIMHHPKSPLYIMPVSGLHSLFSMIEAFSKGLLGDQAMFVHI